MRMVKWNAFLSGLCGVAVALGLVAATASADVTTERGASILAFPKVMVDGDNETIIQITNVSNSMVHARCFYVNVQRGSSGRPMWQETDFNIWLTKQQPTQWTASTGRRVSPIDDCFSDNEVDPTACATAGIDPGAVPPLPDDFIGELKCIEVDAAGNPIGGNHLKGEATIIVDGDVSKYNAVGIEGTELAGGTGNLLLLDQPSDTMDAVGQYNACPNVLILNHFAEGVTDPVVAANGRGGTPSIDPLVSATQTELTLMPCSEDFENQICTDVTIQFLITNEYEQRFSASTTIDCWGNFSLYEVDSPNNPELSVFSYDTLGTTVAQTRISPVSGEGGLVGVAGVIRADVDSNLARAALNIHIEGDRYTASEGAVVDEIILPEQ